MPATPETGRPATAGHRTGMARRPRPLTWIALAAVAALAAGCATQGERSIEPPTVPEPIRDSRADQQSDSETIADAPEDADAAEDERRPRAERTPPAPRQKGELIQPSEAPLALEGEATTLNVDGLTLPAFINEVFGNILGLDFQIAPPLREREDRVSLRISQPEPPETIFKMANEVLASYGVGLIRDDELLRFVRADEAAGDDRVPLLSSGRALPSVPDGNRPVFHVVPLEVISNREARSWIQKAFQGTELTVEGSPARNAVLLRGPAAVVRHASRAVRLFDQPHLRGRHGLRLNPRFRDAEALASDLVDVLNAEGYSAGSSRNAKSVVVLPMSGVGAVFVFATSNDTLAHVRQWAESLDQPGRTGSDGDGIYYYRVRNTSAATLAETVARVLGGGGGGAGRSKGDDQQIGDNQGSGGNRQGTGGSGGLDRDTGRSVNLSGTGLTVDRPGNGLIFNGDPETWGRIRPLIERLDRPAPQVLVEVAVVEITLDEQHELGIEGLLQDIDLGGDLTGQISTQGGLGLGGSGLTATLNDPGDGQLVLNAFQRSERVNFLSRPHLMVKSGQEASIDVGTEVPVITSQASSDEFDQGGDSGIIQEVQFRETGVILEILPVVRGNQTVDVVVRQEVSEAQPTQTSDINSPSIFRRAVQTQLSLRDGTPVLMGGLISEDASVGTSGVPLVKDIPWLGRLFRVDSESTSRTELMVLMTPYILQDHEDAAEITRDFERALEGVQPSTGTLLPGNAGQGSDTGRGNGDTTPEPSP